jgi:hypothetical protein
VAPITKPVENVDQSDIDACKCKTSNLQTKHKHRFGGELNLNLILDFAQCNLKSHSAHPNASKIHDETNTISLVTMLVLIIET